PRSSHWGNTSWSTSAQSIDTRRLRSKTASASDSTRAFARNAACSQNAGSPTGHPSAVKVGVVEAGPVGATVAGADEPPVAAPGGSMSGWYPQAARPVASMTAIVARIGRRTAGTYGFTRSGGSRQPGQDRRGPQPS